MAYGSFSFGLMAGQPVITRWGLCCWKHFNRSFESVRMHGFNGKVSLHLSEKSTRCNLLKGKFHWYKQAQEDVGVWHLKTHTMEKLCFTQSNQILKWATCGFNSSGICHPSFLRGYFFFYSVQALVLFQNMYTKGYVCLFDSHGFARKWRSYIR